MTDISFDDYRLVVKLITRAAKEASDRKVNSVTTKTVLDLHSWDYPYRWTEDLADVTRLIAEDKISSVQEVISLLTEVTTLPHSITTEKIYQVVFVFATTKLKSFDPHVNIPLGNSLEMFVMSQLL